MCRLILYHWTTREVKEIICSHFFFRERESSIETFHTVLFQVKNFTFCIEFNYTLLHRQVVSNSCDCMDCRPTRLLSPWHFPGKNTGVGCHFLLQDIFLAQGLNLCFLHCRLSLSHRGHLNTSDLGLGDSAPIVLSFKLGVGPLHCPPNSLHHGLPILLPMAQRSKRSVSLPFIIIP